MTGRQVLRTTGIALGAAALFLADGQAAEERAGTDSWRRTQLMSEDDGKSWSPLFVDEMRRR